MKSKKKLLDKGSTDVREPKVSEGLEPVLDILGKGMVKIASGTQDQEPKVSEDLQPVLDIIGKGMVKIGSEHNKINSESDPEFRSSIVTGSQETYEQPEGVFDIRESIQIPNFNYEPPKFQKPELGRKSPDIFLGQSGDPSDSKKEYKKQKLPKRKIVTFGMHFGTYYEAVLGSLYKANTFFSSPDIRLTEILQKANEIYDTSLVMTEEIYKYLPECIKVKSRLIDCTKFESYEQVYSIWTCDIFAEEQEPMEFIDT